MNITKLALAALFATMSLTPALAETQTAGATSTIPAARVANYFENFASTIIPSSGTASVGKDGKSGIFAAYNPATGRSVVLAGVGGSGTYKASKSGKSGPCLAVSGFAATNDGAGLGSLAYYQLDCPNEKIPVSAGEANALFTAAFGPLALRGQNLSQVKSGPYGHVAAWYTVRTESASWTNWWGVKVSSQINVMRSIALVNGKLCAIYTAGHGKAWGEYAK